MEVKPPIYSWTVINTGAAVAVSPTKGVLRQITFSDPGTAWEVDVYDGTGTTGTRMATFRSPVSGSARFDLPYFTGLFIDAVKGTTPGTLTAAYLAQ